jgi:alkylhydroperoxidase family enzyme
MGAGQTSPRLAPLAIEELTADAEGFLATPMPGGKKQTDSPFLMTMARHLPLFKRFSSLSAQLLYKGAIPHRQRELAILRTGWLCQAPTEWGQHVQISHAVGITGEDVERVMVGPDASGWNELDQAVVRAVDELHHHGKIGDSTWDVLGRTFDERQLIELPLLVGNYHAVAWVQNSLQVPPEPGCEGLAAR